MDKEQMKKLKEFIINRVKIGDRVYPNYYDQEGRFSKYVSISCPCGEDRLFGKQEDCTKEGVFKYWKPENMASQLLNHIEYQIRMNASKFHIELLKEIIGEEETLKKLESFAKRNLVVALALKKYVEEMKKKILITGGQSNG